MVSVHWVPFHHLWRRGSWYQPGVCSVVVSAVGPGVAGVPFSRVRLVHVAPSHHRSAVGSGYQFSLSGRFGGGAGVVVAGSGV